MAARVREHIRSNVYGLVAVFIALGGTAWAANQVGSSDIKPNAVRSKHIKAGQVRAADLRRGGIGSRAVANGALGASDVDPDQIQRRVSAECSEGQAVARVHADGSVRCVGTGGPPSGSAGGDLTGVYPDPVIAAGAVGSTKVSDNSLDAADVADSGSLGTREIGEGLLDVGGDLAGTVADSEIEPGAVGSSELAAGAVSGGTGGAVEDGTLTGADLAVGAVSGGAGGDIQDNTVGADDLVDPGVWHEVPLASGWAQPNESHLANVECYVDPLDVVHFRGRARRTGAATSSGEVASIVPPPCWPSSQTAVLGATVSSGNDAHGVAAYSIAGLSGIDLHFTTRAGGVQTNEYVSFDGISYRAAS